MSAGVTSADGASAVERVRAAYARTAAVDRPEVWITLRPAEDVLAEAGASDAALAGGADLPLHGVVLAVKDNVDVAGLPTTCACPEFAYLPEVTAPAVARLVAAGALVLGKTNMDQFATGLVGTRSPHGAVRHAHDPSLVSGGSSSGSAVAVALGIADLAVGTDTAGSGRVPAALHGIVGVKTTLGLVPTTGVVPACVDYDAVTLFARELPLAVRGTATMVGPDAGDPRSRPWPGSTPLGVGPAPRLAVPRAADLTALCSAYRAAFDATLDRARAVGIELVTVDISPLLAAAQLLYDGAIVAQRYAAVGEFLATAPAGADPTVSAIVLGAEAATGHGYVDDLDALARAGRVAAALLAEVDGLLLPTTTEHPTIAAVADEPLAINRRMGTFTNFANLLDLAAVAVPGAPTPDGAPFGVTVVVPAFADQVAVDLAALVAGQETALLADGVGVDLLVVGAHLRGLPLHHQLTERGARFLGEVATAPAYRLLDLGTTPPKPGLVRVAAGGASIAGELVRLAPEHLGTFLAALPAPMSLGPVELADGRWVTGFGASADTTGTDVTAHGGWRAYRAAVPARV